MTRWKPPGNRPGPLVGEGDLNPHTFGHRNLNPAVCQFRHSPE